MFGRSCATAPAQRRAARDSASRCLTNVCISHLSSAIIETCSSCGVARMISRTTACGRWFTVRNIRPRYSPINPSITSCVPEKIRNADISQPKPVAGAAIHEPQPQDDDKCDQPKRRRREAGEGGETQRQQRKIQPRAQPQPQQPPQRVAALRHFVWLVGDDDASRSAASPAAAARRCKGRARHRRPPVARRTRSRTGNWTGRNLTAYRAPHR